MKIFRLKSCESCDEWLQFLDEFSQSLKHSGNNDVAIGKAECSISNGLCGGIPLSIFKKFDLMYQIK